MPPGTEKSEADSRPMQLVRSMIRSLENGEIQPGSKLPSIRQSIRLSGFSQGTVVEAYRILLDMGRIQSVPGGGYYATGQSTDESPRPEQIRLLQRLSLDPALDRTLSLGNKTMVASFGLAVPSEDMLPVSALKRCLMEAYRLENVHTYSFPPGLEELRKQIDIVCFPPSPLRFNVEMVNDKSWWSKVVKSVKGYVAGEGGKEYPDPS